MTISPFFRNLRTAYRAEMDDLTFDSDGRDVLRQRLGEKRQEIGFLVQMMALSPEMVAVIFHQGLRFTEPAVMEHLLSHEADELPEWASVCAGVDLTPWARELSEIILKAPAGEWFLTVAAGLQYMADKPDNSDKAFAGQDGDQDSEDHDDSDQDDDSDGVDDFNDHESDEVRGDARDRKEAGASWLEGQGFDHKN